MCSGDEEAGCTYSLNYLWFCMTEGTLFTLAKVNPAQVALIVAVVDVTKLTH